MYCTVSNFVFKQEVFVSVGEYKDVREWQKKESRLTVPMGIRCLKIFGFVGVSQRSTQHLQAVL